MIAFLGLLLLLPQGAPAPLRKSDLVRLLSSAALTQPELARAVSRSCLTFAPTARDRSDLRQLGASPEVLAAIDACARRATRSAASSPRAVAALPPPASVPVAPRPAVSERSAFVAGGGQRGAAGERLGRPLIFEARDTAGRPLSGQAITFVAINARVEPVAARTDGAGHVRVGVTLGERPGSATVIASAGVVEKQVALHVTPGPASALSIGCGATRVVDRVAVRPDTVVTLAVGARDRHGNATALTGLRAAVADARIVRVLRIAEDSATGTVALKPGTPGTTSIAVIASGLRRYVSITVPPRAAPGPVDC